LNGVKTVWKQTTAPKVKPVNACPEVCAAGLHAGPGEHADPFLVPRPRRPALQRLDLATRPAAVSVGGVLVHAGHLVVPPHHPRVGPTPRSQEQLAGMLSSVCRFVVELHHLGVVEAGAGAEGRTHEQQHQHQHHAHFFGVTFFLDNS